MELLYEASHFEKAIQNQWHIIVYQQDEILDEGGIIERQTLETVVIGGNHYIKKSCQFIASNN
ncbi:hypothetical protein [Paenibacillus xylanilyticus]|uniref:hypothetical protein n=1 Tax=Paenibacillus xylanilyticus TaxID=248903 RepID=UPI0039A3D2BF